MRKICPNCGSSKVDDSLVCFYCGKQLEYSIDGKKLLVVFVKRKEESTLDLSHRSSQAVSNYQKKQCPHCYKYHDMDVTICPETKKTITQGELPSQTKVEVKPLATKPLPAVTSHLPAYTSPLTKEKTSPPSPQRRKCPICGYMHSVDAVRCSVTGSPLIPYEREASYDEEQKKKTQEKELNKTKYEELKERDRLLQEKQRERELEKQLLEEQRELEEIAEEMPPIEDIPRTVISGLRCPFCGNLHEEETVFCPATGKRIKKPSINEEEEKILRCPFCENIHPPDTGYCPLTGKRIKELVEKKIRLSEQKKITGMYKEELYKKALNEYRDYQKAIETTSSTFYKGIRAKIDLESKSLKKITEEKLRKQLHGKSFVPHSGAENIEIELKSNKKEDNDLLDYLDNK